MTERPILITGCSSGIGLCLAQGLKKAGYQVIASARQQADVDRLKGEGFDSVKLNLSDSNSIDRGLREALDLTGGRLFGLINNGAYGQPGAVEDLSRAVLKAQFETNLFGTHELTCLVLPIMREQGEGRIIQISSVLGLVCLNYRGAYNASKYALEALSDTMRLELRDTNIHVCLVEPGPISSKFRDNAWFHFEKNIDLNNSVHTEHYKAVKKRLSGKGKKIPFTLGPEAVLAKVEHALSAKKPKVRYFVTFPTYLFATLKRVLPDKWLDEILCKI